MQALAGEDPGGRIRVVQAVEPPGGRRLLIEAHQLGNRGLHLEGQLIVADGGLEAVMVAHPAQHALVEPAQEVELASLQLRRCLARARCSPPARRWA